METLTSEVEERHTSGFTAVSWQFHFLWICACNRKPLRGESMRESVPRSSSGSRAAQRRRPHANHSFS